MDANGRRSVDGGDRVHDLQDWYDGRLSDRLSCAAVVVASTHLPVDRIYSTVAEDLSRYAPRVCTRHTDLAAVKVGMADTDVAAIAGAPQVPAAGSCWDYWGEGRDHNCTQLCFRSGRVISRGTLYHWSSAVAAGSAVCDLARLHATAGLQGATGSLLGGINLSNPGPSCKLAGRPVVELNWHGKRITPPQTPFDPRAFRSMSPFHLSRTLAHGKSLFVWVQWWNYCGPKSWGSGSFRPVAAIRVRGEPGSLTARFRDAIVPPFCNSPRYSRFSVSDFGTAR